MSNSTVIVKSSGGTYSSLSQALATQEANYPNLTADCNNTGSAGILTIECYAMVDTTAVSTGTGWTVSADYYINITVVAAARHAGVYSETDKYVLKVSGNALVVGEHFTRITGLTIYSTNAGGLPLSGGVFFARDCLIFGTLYTSINAYSGSCDYVFQNCVFIANNENYTVRGGQPMNYYFLNCTVINQHASGVGLSRGGGTWVAKNCYAGTGGGAAYSGTITKTNCAASDTTSDGTNPYDEIALSTDTFTSVDALTAFDAHLVAGSGLIDVGADLSGEAGLLAFSADFEGGARSGTWDIGADEYVAGAPPAGGAAIFNPYDEVII